MKHPYGDHPGGVVQFRMRHNVGWDCYLSCATGYREVGTKDVGDNNHQTGEKNGKNGMRHKGKIDAPPMCGALNKLTFKE